jgi:hypothetical protein
VPGRSAYSEQCTNTCRIVTARSRATDRFIQNASIRMVWAFSAFIMWLKPLQRIMGISGPIRHGSWANVSPLFQHLALMTSKYQRVM